MSPTENTFSPFRRGYLVAAALLAVLGVGFLLEHSMAGEIAPVPAPALDEPQGKGSETAVLAGGCFWGMQGVFQHVQGVTEAISGYTGGSGSTAEYETVSTGTTGHAESVRITFDRSRISYGRILQIYFTVAHDPTELDRQGPDDGTQYRSAIFPLDADQARIAKAYIQQIEASHAFDVPIVTTIEPGRTFYPAEAYHQNFLALNPTYPYIVVNDLPKIAALKERFPDRYRADPVLFASPPIPCGSCQ